MNNHPLRLNKTEKRYQRDRIAGRTRSLWDVKPIREFKYFKVIPNNYPHDRLARVNNILIPIRRVEDWRDLNWRERREFRKLHDIFSVQYDSIKLNYPSMLSVRNIVHWHLYIY